MAIQKLSPFRLWVLQNFPFIAEDFDALTNYELMCKIVEYLNKVIDITNEQTTAINYLLNWFDNLDVQDEINNKLDQMAESGELAEIISAYLNSNALIVFSNVESLKNADNLIAGSRVKTLGYHTYNDGGGATYIVRKVTNQDTENDMDIIALNDENLVAEYIPSDSVYVKQFGAYGDNSHDDTTSLQYAINYTIKNQNVGKLILNKGNYLISSTLNIKKYNNSYVNITIEGESQAIIRLSSNFATNNTNVILIDGEVEHIQETNNMLKYLLLRNINIEDRSATVKNVRGIEIKSCQFLTFENVYIHGCKIQGIRLTDVYDSSFINCKIIRCGFYEVEADVNNCGLLLRGTYDNVNACKFYGLQIEFANTLLQVSDGCRHNEFTDCKFETGNYQNNGSVPRVYISGDSYENTFTNCQFVKNAKDGANDDVYFMNAQDNETPAHQTGKFYLKIDGCMFTTWDNLSGKWLVGKGVVLVNSQLNHCNDANSSSAPLLINGNCIISNNQINNVSVHKDMFNLNGTNNIISNNVITLTNTTATDGVFMRIGSTFNNSSITDNVISGPITYTYSGETWFKDNIINNNVGYKNVVSSSNAQKLNCLFGSDNFILTGSTATTITEIRYGYNGQIITITSTTGAHTIENNQYIKTTSGSNISLSANKPVEFININNIWYQI